MTDTHIVADPAGRLLGQSTRRTFEAVLELARSRCWPPDLILLTGDLVHDEEPLTYRYLARCLRDLRIPYLCIPGNHDRRDQLTGILDADAARAVHSHRVGGWHLLLLDSTLTGEDGGLLTPEQLASIERALSRHPEPTLVSLHHQPVPVGSAWLDRIGLRNGADLIALVERYPQVRGLVWGHVHQDFVSDHLGIRLLGSPSTCVQFLPGSETFAVDPQPPGLRWLVLSADGEIETWIERLDGYPDPLDLAAEGY